MFFLPFDQASLSKLACLQTQLAHLVYACVISVFAPQFYVHEQCRASACFVCISCSSRSWLLRPLNARICSLFGLARAETLRRITTLVQLYAHSGQLPTAEGMFSKKSLDSPICHFGCPDIESPHHIFVICGRFSELRSKEHASLYTTIKNKLDDTSLNPIDQAATLHTVKYIFSDSDNVWPLHSAMFFLGQIPKIETLINPLAINNSVTRSRLIHNIALDIHLLSVRLASRIFGDLQKVMSKRHIVINGPTGPHQTTHLNSPPPFSFFLFLPFSLFFYLLLKHFIYHIHTISILFHSLLLSFTLFHFILLSFPFIYPFFSYIQLTLPINIPILLTY